MNGQEAIVLKKIGPYDGVYEKRLVTYKLKIKSNAIITWHENGKRGLFAKVGDIVEGLWVENGKPNYKMSKIVNKQKLF